MSNYTIVMFAHNEANNINDAIDSVYQSVDESFQRLLIVANGCTDSTVEIVNELIDGGAYTSLKIAEIALPDKSNAWNQYVYEYASSDDTVHFFIDADVTFSKNVFPMMNHQLVKDPKAIAIAGLPLSGRNRKAYLTMVKERNCLFGNCYGLTAKALQLIKQRQFRLPVGLNWIDSAITKGINRNFDSSKEPIPSNITWIDGVGYQFKSLSPFSREDWIIYWNRIIRYRLGKLQEEEIEAIPFDHWPRDLYQVNQTIMEKLNGQSGFRSAVANYFVAAKLKKLNQKISDSLRLQ